MHLDLNVRNRSLNISINMCLFVVIFIWFAGGSSSCAFCVSCLLGCLWMAPQPRGRDWYTDSFGCSIKFSGMASEERSV